MTYLTHDVTDKTKEIKEVLNLEPEAARTDKFVQEQISCQMLGS